MATEHIIVAAKDDFVAKHTKSRPVPALAELVWNALDADATIVTVELVHGDLGGGLSRIVIADNGAAFSREQAKEYFGSLGGSWKRLKHETDEGRRSIHGQEGKGRYKAFALGGSVVWQVVHGDISEKRVSFSVTMNADDLTGVSISPSMPASGSPRGVTVVIENVQRDFRAFENEDGLQEMAEIFAHYLINYNNVVIEVAGRKVDPEAAILSKEIVSLASVADHDGLEHKFDLFLIEWRGDTKKMMYLCSKQGFPLHQVETRFHTLGFSFSAYLRSSYVSALEKEGRLGLAELDPQLSSAIAEARDSIKTIFRTRAAQASRSVVEQWKADDIYPFKGEPQSSVEIAERQIFDIVASEIQQLTPDLQSAPTKAQELHLRMLRNAIGRGPEELQTIFREVLDLPIKKQKELAALLQETSLSAIITAAKTVADRLKFIDALESIVFSPETKGRLKERTQLHRILAENTWVFGEEYNLWVSDKGLKMVLEKHRAHLAQDIAIEDPIVVYGQKSAIVDMMFSRTSRRHRADDIEHLIVELKAPKVKIGADEIVQIKKYHLAVTSDERFLSVSGVRWHFMVVSNDYDNYAKGEIEGGPDRERRLISRNKHATVAIKTWGEIIEENRARLQFFQEHLQSSADEGQAIKYLRDRHSDLLKGVFDTSDPTEVDAVPKQQVEPN
jgi:Histidine kinase-, DNA gyrase B-, and HSP90-like ATPase